MEGRVDGDALARLTSALAERPREDVVAFQERLALALFELDRRVAARQPVRFSDDPDDDEPLPLSDDSFLYLRAGVVARGQQVWQSVIADPSVLSTGVWDDGEDLLNVAEEVFGDYIDTDVSYETGSNERYWPDLPEPDTEPWDEGHRLVFVECRDLTRPIRCEKHFPDGRIEPDVEYVPPKYISDSLVEELVLTFSRLITVGGGLPAEAGADQLVVRIDFGDEPRTEPIVGAPVEDEEFDVGMIRPVQVGVQTDTARSWTADETRLHLRALTATCILAVLPAGHPAHPQILRIATVL